MDFEQARYHMIEQQIRPWEVLDQRVLDLMADMPREDFVPEEYRNLAYADTDIPLPHGQVMMAPRIEARLLQALAVSPSDRVLEIGTGSGCLTCQLARASRHVYSMDIFPDFCERASEKLAAHGVVNVTTVNGDGVHGLEQNAPYDVIAVTGSLPYLDESLQRQLDVGGRMFVIVGEAPVMEALLVTRTGQQDWTTEALFETDLPALQDDVAPGGFEF